MNAEQLAAHRDNFERRYIQGAKWTIVQIKADRQGTGYKNFYANLAWQAYEWALADVEKHLVFIERWAVHHASKPHITAGEALGVLAHYPPIKAITNSYANGCPPETFDPCAEIERLKDLLDAITAQQTPPAARHRAKIVMMGDSILSDKWHEVIRYDEAGNVTLHTVNGVPVTPKDAK